MSETAPQIRKGDKAVIIQHCAVFGHLKTEVREFRVNEPRPYAQYPVAVHVSFTEPRKRKGGYYTMTPDSLRYLTIKVKDRTVYDSRLDVPCDMAAWEATYQKNRALWLKQKAENDAFDARHPGVTTTTMGNFED